MGTRKTTSDKGAEQQSGPTPQRDELLKRVVDPKGEHDGKNCQADEIEQDGVVHI